MAEEFNLEAYSDETLAYLLSLSAESPLLMQDGSAEVQIATEDDIDKMTLDEGIFDFTGLMTLAPEAIEQSPPEMQATSDMAPPFPSSDPFLYEDSSATPGSSSSRSANRRTSRSSDEGIDMSPNNDSKHSSYADEEYQSLLDGIPDASVLNLEQSRQDSPPSSVDSDPDARCFVCKEKAGKHSYYGGRVCPSCRAFFRRAVQSKYYEIFFCTKGERCEINLKTRRSCQFCRFKKCLDSGMRIAWVLPDGERNRRFNKLNKVAQRNTISSEQALVPIRRTPVMSVTNEELGIIDQVHQQLQTFTCKTLEDHWKANPTLLVELAKLGYFGGSANCKFQKQFNAMCNRATQEIFLAMDEFKRLPYNDRRKLFEANGEILNRFKWSACIQEANSGLAQGIECATKSGKFPELNEISEKLEELNLTNLKPQLSYDQFFTSPWAANYADEERHFELMLRMKAWPRDNLESPVDEVQMSLMKAILAFSADFVELERPDIVQSVQLRYANLLQKYLKFKYGSDANRRFAEGLMMSAYARESNEIQHKKRLLCV